MPEYIDVFASDSGMIRKRHRRTGIWSASFGCSDTHGYLQIRVEGRNRLVHRLVAMAFHSNHKFLPEVNHKNGVKSDNRQENLEWSTSSQNSRHAVSLGLKYGLKGEKNHHSKLTSDQARGVYDAVHKLGLSFAYVGTLFGISNVQASNIARGKQWRHLGLHSEETCSKSSAVKNPSDIQPKGGAEALSCGCTSDLTMGQDPIALPSEPFVPTPFPESPQPGVTKSGIGNFKGSGERDMP